MSTRRPERPNLKRGKQPNAAAGPRSSAADLRQQLHQRTRELAEAQKLLAESHQQQIATAEALQVINSSPGDLAPVFDMILEKAHRLCGVAHGALLLYDGEKFSAVAVRGLSTVLAERLRQGYVPGPNHPSWRLLEGERFAHVQDWAKIDDPIAHDAIRAGVRTTLFIPLRGQGKLLGQIGASRLEVKPFTEMEIALLESFAAQAVIAMENARLLSKLRDRQAELRVTFDNMGDGVVMFDSEARLAAWNRNFQEMLDLPDTFLAGRPSYAQYFRHLADRGEYSTDLEAQLSRTIEDTSREMRFERTRPDGRVVEVRRNPVPGGSPILPRGSSPRKPFARHETQPKRPCASCRPRRRAWSMRKRWRRSAS